MSNLASKIRSKFLEPRAVLKEGKAGAELMLGSGKKITGSTTDEAMDAYKMLYGPPEVQDKLVKEAAAKAGAAKERELEQYFDKKQARKAGEISQDTVTEALPQQSFLEKAQSMNSVFKRKALQAIAQKLGKKGDALDTEGSSRDIMEAAAEKLGIPADSVAGNAAKAVGVGLLELAPGELADFVPASKLSKAAGALTKSKALQSALAKLRKASEAGEVVGKQTGVDTRSFKALKEALAKKMP